MGRAARARVIRGFSEHRPTGSSPLDLRLHPDDPVLAVELSVEVDRVDTLRLEPFVVLFLPARRSPRLPENLDPGFGRDPCLGRTGQCVPVLVGGYLFGEYDDVF